MPCNSNNIPQLESYDTEISFLNYSGATFGIQKLNKSLENEMHLWNNTLLTNPPVPVGPLNSWYLTKGAPNFNRTISSSNVIESKKRKHDDMSLSGSQSKICTSFSLTHTPKAISNNNDISFSNINNEMEREREKQREREKENNKEKEREKTIIKDRDRETEREIERERKTETNIVSNVSNSSQLTSTPSISSPSETDVMQPERERSNEVKSLINSEKTALLELEERIFKTIINEE